MSVGLLIDTSVWSDHFAGRDASVAPRLLSEPVVIHEFILGELLLGVLPRGHRAAGDLANVPRVETLPHEEVVRFVRLHRLEGSGVGWVHAHLLASARVFDAAVWTKDQSLAAAAKKVGVAAGRLR